MLLWIKLLFRSHQCRQSQNYWAVDDVLSLNIYMSKSLVLKNYWHPCIYNLVKKITELNDFLSNNNEENCWTTSSCSMFQNPLYSQVCEFILQLSGLQPQLYLTQSSKHFCFDLNVFGVQCYYPVDGSICIQLSASSQRQPGFGLNMIQYILQWVWVMRCMLSKFNLIK